MKKIIKQYLDIAGLSLGRAGQIIAQIVSVRIATTLLTQQQMGLVNLIQSVVALGSSTLISPVSGYLERGFIEWAGTGDLIRNIVKFLRYIFIITLISMVGVFICQSSFSFISNITPGWLVLLTMLFVLGSSISGVATSSFNIMGHRGKFIFFSNLSMWLGLGLATGLFLIFYRPEFWLLGQYLGLVCSAASIFLLLKCIRQMPLTTDYQAPGRILFNPATAFDFAWPQVITQIFWWFQSQGYRFILEKVAGLQYVGLFVVGYGLCAMPIAAFESVFAQYYNPIFLAALKGQDTDGITKAWNNYMRAYVPAMILAGGFLIGSGPFLTKVFVGERFQQVSTMLIWPALAETIRAIGSSVYFMGVATLNMRILVIPVALGAITANLAVYVLCRLHPLHGTGMALLLGMSVSVTAGLVACSRTLSIQWPVKGVLYAVLLSIPMIIGFRLGAWLLPETTIYQAIIMLLVGGCYFIGAEYLLARNWIIKLAKGVPG